MEQIAQSFVNFPYFFMTWGIFFVAAIISFFVQVFLNQGKIAPIAFLRHCFPFEFWSKKSAQMDVKVYFAGKLIDKLWAWMPRVCTVFVSTKLSGALNVIFSNHKIVQATYLIVLLCSIAIFVVVELSNYLTHYLQHRIPFLWEMHKVHHSATFLSPLTARRGHPLGTMFDGVTGGIFAGIASGFFGFFFGFGLAEIFFLDACAHRLAVVASLDPLKHSQFPVAFGWLDRVLISPHMHHVHHSCKAEHWDKNFGVNLSIWDWMFGTAYKPSKNEEIIYGLGTGEEKDYDRLWGVYVGPLLKIWRLGSGERNSVPTLQDHADRGGGGPERLARAGQEHDEAGDRAGAVVL